MLPNFFRYLYVKLRSAQNPRLYLSVTDDDPAFREASRVLRDDGGIACPLGFGPINCLGDRLFRLNQ